VIVEEEGEVVSLDMGANLALILVQSTKRIEAWQLMKRLIATSKQHLGREHHVTKSLETTSAICKSLIIVTLRSLGLSFEAIGYEDDRYSSSLPWAEEQSSIFERQDWRHPVV
jgi:hypothetical protein